MITVVLGSGGAGMVGQDPHLRADRQRNLRRGAAGTERDDAVLLIGLGHDEVGIGPAIDVADDAVALVDRLLRGAAIARQRHPTRVDEGPAAVGAMADHRREHRQCDVVDRADPDPGHHQVEHHEHAGAHLGDALEPAREMGRRRRADADHGAGQSGRAQRFGAAYRG
ncbi:hypothetical protein chiPu_0030573, partial [Chiloscyllium punctatum]|nr:hypothetical protein [Chiloscyllium punctatum]